MRAWVHVTLHTVQVLCSTLSLKSGSAANACVPSGQCILYNSVVRFVTDEQTVAPWDGACFDIEVEGLDSDDDEDDD